MKTLLFSIFLTVLSLPVLHAQNLYPYVQAFKSTKNINELALQIKQALPKQGIDVLGSYQPADDANRFIIVVSSKELLTAAAKSGGLTGFASALRIALTKENGAVTASYSNPYYWGLAYHQGKFESVKPLYQSFQQKLEQALKPLGTWIGTPFGSKTGIDPEDLEDYQYMFGMPYFQDTEELKSFSSYQDAIAAIERNFKRSNTNLTKVYRIDIPGKEMTLYGVGIGGGTGESYFMPIIDLGRPKHTAFLPYELLVMGDEVHMLHGRFRIALAFPDLTMTTFSKIMSTPGDIEELLEQLVE
jgi:hypothetical protein